MGLLDWLRQRSGGRSTTGSDPTYIPPVTGADEGRDDDDQNDGDDGNGDGGNGGSGGNGGGGGE